MYEIKTEIFLRVINRSRRWLDLQMRKGIFDKGEIFVCMVKHRPVSFICGGAIEKILFNKQR